jgi:hypothetical protein
MTDTLTTPDALLGSFDDNDIFNLSEEGGDKPPYNPILRIWLELLKPVEDLKDAKVTPQWANRICTTYTGMYFSSIDDFRDLYYVKMAQLIAVLQFEIDSDAECLRKATPEEDVEENTGHYLNILMGWQLCFLDWELQWDCNSLIAAAELAAISELHRMFFDQTGVAALLDNIKFVVTDADREVWAEALEDLKNSQEGR